MAEATDGGGLPGPGAPRAGGGGRYGLPGRQAPPHPLHLALHACALLFSRSGRVICPAQPKQEKEVGTKK